MVSKLVGGFSRGCVSALIISLVLGSPVSAGVTAAGHDEPLPVEALLPQPDYLTDPQNRVSPDFKVPPSLEKRVGFWFDIYTKFTAQQHVIHHSDYPWIIFDVVDLAPIMEGEGHRWTKHHKAQRELKSRRAQVVANLQKLSRKIKPSKVTPELIRLRDLLAQIPGKPRAVARIASQSVRTQLGQKDFMASGLINATRYLPLMEETFKKYGLPFELTRLPLVESSFNEEAVSKVGASGVWQLMPAMGRLFLTMRGVLDERNSPLKATDAAAKILKQNHKILKAWPLAVTAYNHGPGGLLRATKKLKTKDLAIIIAKHRGRDFGFASSNFYCEFLAALHTALYQKEIFGDLPENQPMQLTAVKLPRSYRLRAFTKLTGLTLDDIQLLNPELKDNDVRAHTTLPRGYKLFLPPSHAHTIEALWTPPPAQRPAKKDLTSRLVDKPAS